MSSFRERLAISMMSVVVFLLSLGLLVISIMMFIKGGQRAHILNATGIGINQDWDKQASPEALLIFSGIIFWLLIEGSKGFLRIRRHWLRLITAPPSSDEPSSSTEPRI